MWGLYLSGFESAFLTGSLAVMQLQLGRKRDAAPLGRNYMAVETERLHSREAQVGVSQKDAGCAVGSIDRRNTLCELLRWCLILQGLAWPLIQLARDGAQLCLGMNRQVSASRQILSEQPVGVFV